MCQMILILNFKKYCNKNLQWASEFLTLQNFGYHSTWHCFPVLKFTKKYSNIWIVNWLQARYVQFLKKVLNGSGSKQKWIMYHNLQFGRNVCIPFKVQTFWEGHKILRNLHLLSYVVPVKSKVEISQNFVTFSEYMNFKVIQKIC